jgi:hypothetical protein
MGKTFRKEVQEHVQRSFATFAAQIGYNLNGPELLKKALQDLPDLREGYLNYLRCGTELLDIDAAMHIVENMHKLYGKTHQPASAPTPSQPDQLNSSAQPSFRFRPLQFEDVKEIIKKTFEIKKDPIIKYRFASVFIYAYGFQKGNRACGEMKWSNIKAVNGLGGGRVRVEIQDDRGKVRVLEGKLMINENDIDRYSWQDILIAMLQKHFRYTTGPSQHHGILELGAFDNIMKEQIWPGSHQNYVYHVDEIWNKLDRPAEQRPSFGSLKNGGVLDKTFA